MLECIETTGNQPRRKRINYERSQHHVVPRDVRHQSNGVRRLRRIANLNELTNNGEKEEDESHQVEYVDLVNGSCKSVFTKLFLEPENMTMWNNFMNSSEEEQQGILKQRAKHNSECFEDLAACFGEEISAGPTGVDFNAGRCFLRIHHNLRQSLRKNQFPKGELQRQEEELVAFFCECPTSVYVTQISDSFHRLLLHVVSQYLDLHSYSFDNPPGGRQTLVENRTAHFVKPTTSLANFLNSGKVAGICTKAKL